MIRWLMIAAVSTLPLYAVSALSKPREYRTEAGTPFGGTPKGDEYLHWIETDEGGVVLYNKQTRRFEPARIREGRLEPAGEAYRHDGSDKGADKAALRELWKAKREAAAQRREVNH